MLNHLHSIRFEFSDYLCEFSTLLVWSSARFVEFDVVHTTKEDHELTQLFLRLGLLARCFFKQLLAVDKREVTFSKIEIHDDLSQPGVFSVWELKKQALEASHDGVDHRSDEKVHKLWRSRVRSYEEVRICA